MVAVVLAHDPPLGQRRDSALVDVVAQLNDEVEIFLGHETVRRVETRFVVLTRRVGKVDPRNTRARFRKGARPSDRALFTSGRELVPVVLGRIETTHDRVNGVRKLRHRDECLVHDDVRHPVVGGNAAARLDIFSWHAATFERPRRKARP